MKFSYRKYQTGDEIAINDLYHAVTGRTRSVEQHAWQWLQTPAGESEIWLIEAELENGEKKLIGHHGIMALNFSHYGKSIRVGKTENTMVLPEFRDKILYPRYEKKFLAQYEDKFHALFSTFGPASAIRLRTAMGYKAKHQWKKIYLGNETLVGFILIIDITLRKAGLNYFRITAKIPKISQLDNTQIKAYSDDIALSDFDFDSFWESASKKYPLTPSRSKKNMSWRFWNNPYKDYTTLILDNEVLGIAICTVSFPKRYGIYIDDIYCENINNTGRFLEIVHAWAKRFLRVSMLEFYTTSEFDDKSLTNNAFLTPFLLEKIKSNNSKSMPRKITKRGAKEYQFNDATDWFVTSFFAEGV